MLDGEQGLVDGERLLDEVEGAQFGGAHGGLDVAVAGNHDDGGGIFAGANLLERLESVHAGQPDVEQNQIAGFLAQKIQASLAALHGFDAITFVPQHVGQRLADAGFVVDNQ